jgi:hypothetical protein
MVVGYLKPNAKNGHFCSHNRAQQARNTEVKESIRISNT